MTKIWILWDWQLWQLTALEAQSMWIETIVYWNEWEGSPAWQVSRILWADWYYNRSINVDAFISEKPDVVTMEWENVPIQLLNTLNARWLNIKPNSWVFHLIQNRLTEKQAVIDAWASTTSFKEIKDIQDLKYAHFELWEWILKTARDGYDWKWQVRIYSENDIEKAIETLSWKELIYEKIVDYKMEISVIVWRRVSWWMLAFEPAENIHNDWILRTTITPARIDKQIAKQAKKVAMDIAESMWIEWLLAVEMFVLDNWSILINELAPRPHNSWHPTIESYNISQYNVLIKAILDEDFWKLELLKSTRMDNLLWEDINLIPWRDSNNPKQQITEMWKQIFYDYWKKQTKDWRKMWHVTEIL